MSQLAPIGDRGQRYEVVQIQEDGSEMSWGWSDLPDGGSLAYAASKHPATLRVTVRDRKPAAGAGSEATP